MLPVYIFDLDNTLFDTRSIPSSVTSGLFECIRKFNHRHECVSDSVLSQVFEESWSLPFPTIAAKYSLPEQMVNAWRQCHETLTFTEPLLPFPDVHEALSTLRTRQHELCLLTSGYRGFQQAKINALGLAKYFDLVLIDSVDESHAGKESILAELLQLRDWKPADLRIVGDSETNEIAAGIRLQIPTIQILRPGIRKAETASRHIMTLLELL